MEGQGDFVSKLRVRIIRDTIWVIGFINPLTLVPPTLQVGFQVQAGLGFQSSSLSYTLNPLREDYVGVI